MWKLIGAFFLPGPVSPVRSIASTGSNNARASLKMALLLAREKARERDRGKGKGQGQDKR